MCLEPYQQLLWGTKVPTFTSGTEQSTAHSNQGIGGVSASTGLTGRQQLRDTRFASWGFCKT